MAVKYRELRDNEIICEGDQFIMNNNKWCPAMSIGHLVGEVGIRYRRPIREVPRKTTRNTGGPKLPEWENLWAALPPAPADWGCDIPTAVEIYRYGAQSAYDFIERQLRARV